MKRATPPPIPWRIVELFDRAMALDRRLVQPGQVMCFISLKKRRSPVVFRLGGAIHESFDQRRLSAYYRFKAAQGFGADFRRWE